MFSSWKISLKKDVKTEKDGFYGRFSVYILNSLNLYILNRANSIKETLRCNKIAGRISSGYLSKSKMPKGN
jgi:hypothetical protein